MYSNLRICIIGDGLHSKRVQRILSKKKCNFDIFKPANKKKTIMTKNFKKYHAIFIMSPDNTHYYYIKKLFKCSYIFCEKPPCTKKKHLQYLLKIKSRKIYYNYNFRFSKIFKIMQVKYKFKLGNLLYGNIIYGQALGLKKNYKNQWRSKKNLSPKGILQVVSIHFIDFVNYFFPIKNIETELKSLSNFGNSFDNATVKITTKNNALIHIYNSWTSQLINVKKFIFQNGSIEQDEKFITVKGPALSLDKNNFTKLPNTIKKFKFRQNKDSEKSLEESVNFFLKNVLNKKLFCRKSITHCLLSNKFVI
jgi:predicted dehydrogenase